MLFLKLIIAFAPWLAFLLIAHDSLFRLKLGLLTALVLSIAMGLAGLHRGIILWVGLAFFSCATLAVNVFNNMGAVKYMGIIASGTLAISTWLTLITKRPFTMEYAKEHTEPSLWNSPIFVRTNMLLTAAWGTTFTINALLAWGKMEHLFLTESAYEIISYTLMLGTAGFTTWYPGHIRQKTGTSVNSASKTGIAD